MVSSFNDVKMLRVSRIRSLHTGSVVTIIPIFGFVATVNRCAIRSDLSKALMVSSTTRLVGQRDRTGKGLLLQHTDYFVRQSLGSLRGSLNIPNPSSGEAILGQIP